MSRWLSLLRKELATLWLSPLPYVVGALFHAVAGTLYVEQLDVRGQALYQPLFPLAGFLLLALVPLLSMRAFAEERQSRTLPLLLSVPVAASRLVSAKWAAAGLTTLAVLLPLAVPFGLVASWGDPDPGPAISGSLGLVLLGLAVAGLGTLTSSLTSSQAVAGMLAFFASLALWFSHVGSSAWAGGGVLAHFSLSERLRSFAGGVVDLTDVGLLAVLTAGTLAIAGFLVQRSVARRMTKRRPPQVLAILAVGVLLFGVDRAASLVDFRWDLTAEASLTLSDQTKEVVRALDEPVEVVAFVPQSSPLRTQTAALLERYRELNRSISFRLSDPERSPAQAVQMGIDPEAGGVVFRSGNRSQTAGLTSEQDFTSALARLQRAESPGACFTTGHGEADPSSSTGPDLGAAAGSLVANGYRVRAVDLLSGQGIPEGCDALVIANPVVPLGEPAQASVEAYLSSGGRALVLADPVSEADLNPVIAPYGLRIDRGLVVEGDDGARLGPDPLTFVVREFRSPNPAVRRLPPVLFAGALAVGSQSDPAAGLAADPIATSSASSFLERRPMTGQTGFEPRFDAADDLAGPVQIAAAADRSRREAGGVVRTRLIVVGDSDWATNALLGEGGNSRLFIQSMDWLTVEEDLVSVTTNLAAFRPLELSPARLATARILTVGGVPALFVLAYLGLRLARRRL